MKMLSDAALLDLAAQDEAARPGEAARRWLALAWPDCPAERWAMLDGARRDTLLLLLRRARFGDLLQAESCCPACGERVEYELDAAHLAGDAQAQMLLADAASIELALADRVLRLRRPLAEDLALATSAPDLMRRCLLDADAESQALCGEPASIQAFGAALAEELPLADPQIGLQCPACGAAWEETFEAWTFLQADLRAAADRLLDEVHTLALAYHWPERDILALPPARRRQYLRRLAA
jgi:hypothetical protein